MDTFPRSILKSDFWSRGAWMCSVCGGRRSVNHSKVGSFSWSFKLLMFCVLLLTLQMFGTPSMAHVLMCLLIPESNWSRSIWTRRPLFSLTTTSFHRIQPAQWRERCQLQCDFSEYYLNTKPLPLQGRFLFLSVMNLFTTRLLCLYLYFPECKPWSCFPKLWMIKK